MLSTTRFWLKAFVRRLFAGNLPGRVLLALTGLLLVVMPWTEHRWNWDGFGRGGQDVEFGLLATAAVLCLAVLLAHHRAQLVAHTLLPDGERTRAPRPELGLPVAFRPAAFRLKAVARTGTFRLSLRI